MVTKKSYPKQTVFIPGDSSKTIHFACDCFVELAKNTIDAKGLFSIALSGGSTPKKFYQAITKTPYKEAIDWTRVLVFWSDERGRPLDHKESNYRMAMVEGHLQNLPLVQEHIFPMHVTDYQKEHAKKYEALLQEKLGSDLFDLVLLGVGEDGHIASLFPNSSLFEEKKKLVAAHFLTEKNMWRMTLTLPCIEKSQKTVILALGSNKSSIVKSVLDCNHCPFPAGHVGSPEKKAIWIVDNQAGMLL